MFGTSIQGKIMTMEDAVRDSEAESELEKLEERLGLKPKATEEAAVQTVSVGGEAEASVTPATPDTPVSEAEKQLEELEKRLQGG